SNVAVSAELKVGDEFHSSHGLLEGGEVHDDHHFVVTGVLEHSGTVIDNLILTDTESVWKVHHDEEANEHHEEDEHDESHHKEHKDHDDHDHTDDKKEITAMLVKFRNPMGHLRIPRQINETTNMQAAVPAIEVSRLKSLLGVGFQTINGIAFVIMVVSGLSIFIGLYNSLNKRRQEMAFLRVQGASRWQLVQLVLQEGIILTILGVIFGVILSRMVLWSTTYFLDLNSNLGAKFYALLKGEIWLMAVALFIGFLASIIPTIQSYKIDIPKTLSDV
ncbi:MAG: ABC transporter permease, partial [Flavobacteriales bacterium]|nr:ABC transporter permease [Flavobacteriales bacterium]